MSYLKVVGKNRLQGEIKVQGSKNSCLPMLAAAILANDKIVINNCPHISDVEDMLEVLKVMGCKWEFEDCRLTLLGTDLKETPLPMTCKKIRGSMSFMGAMLSRFGKVRMPWPGGCDLGHRPIDFHVDGLKTMGVGFEFGKEHIFAEVKNENASGSYCFPKPSLGALENLILRAVSIKGQFVFENCTKEPEIVDFCDFLNAMGACIKGAGTDRVVVTGGRQLTGCEYTLPGDRIVAGTYMAMVSVTNGNVLLKGINGQRLGTEIDYLRKIGCHVFTDSKSNEIIIIGGERKKSYPCIFTGPYPEFSTDLQPQMLAAACFYNGTTFVKDEIYPLRFGVTGELLKMGADIIMDRGVAVVRGKEELTGTELTASDLRAGAALVVAALGAEGESNIYGTEHILRGYEDIQRDLKKLGADIEWIEEEEKRT